MQYDGDAERLVCSRVLVHPAEVWDLSPCPASADLLLSVWSQGECVVVCHEGGALSQIQKLVRMRGHMQPTCAGTAHAGGEARGGGAGQPAGPTDPRATLKPMYAALPDLACLLAGLGANAALPWF
jgi:hypothetical protein